MKASVICKQILNYEHVALMSDNQNILNILLEKCVLYFCKINATSFDILLYNAETL